MPYFIKLVLLTTAMVFPLAVFVWWRGRAILGSLRWKGAIISRKVFSGLLLSFLIYPAYLLIWHYGDMDLSYNDQSRFLALYFWIGMVFITQLFWVLSTLLILLFGLKLAFRDYYQKQIRFMPVLASVVMISVLIMVGVNAWHSMKGVVLDPPISIEVPALNEELRLIHISDLQADAFTDEERIRDYIAKVNEQEPDLVLFTGDLITEGQDYMEIGARWLGEINATYGVYAVFGDHDIWHGRNNVRAVYADYGITVLENKNLHLSLPEIQIRLTGLTQAYSERVSEEQLDTLLANSAEADFKLSMAHQPDRRLVDASLRAGYDLFLAGHTHGGQIVQPFFFVEVNPARIETLYPVRAYEVGSLWVNVNAGLGASLSPLRYGNPAAISTIILK